MGTTDLERWLPLEGKKFLSESTISISSSFGSNLDENLPTSSTLDENLPPFVC
jgi:hypothetical protein